jgi:hypothetical protein
MHHLGLGHRLFGFPLGMTNGFGGFFSQPLDAPQADTHATQILQQLAYLPPVLAKVAGRPVFGNDR